VLAILENKDLAAAAEQSKGEFAQAEAGYATTVGAGLPEQRQKPNWTLLMQRRPSTRSRSSITAARSYFKQGALPRRDLDSAQVALRRPTANINKRRNSSMT